MDIVVLSGKGGTGKTTVSVNLSTVASKGSSHIDCDVEEPNSHLFINRVFTNETNVKTNYPVINGHKCIHCGKCGKFCSFNVLLNTKKSNIIMKELCHDCGGCALVCPVDAITYESRTIGKVREGKTINGEPFIDGILNTGEFSTTKTIQNVLQKGQNSKHRIIDAPPGSACAAVETVEAADFALIVTEPTPFAISDMKMVVEMLENMNIPKGIFINKSGEDERELLDYCDSKNIEIMGRLPFKEEYGENYASGNILSMKFPEAADEFRSLWRKITSES